MWLRYRFFSKVCAGSNKKYIIHGLKVKLIEEMKFCRGILKREIKYSKCGNVYLDKSGKINEKHQHKVVKYNHTGCGY